MSHLWDRPSLRACCPFGGVKRSHARASRVRPLVPPRVAWLAINGEFPCILGLTHCLKRILSLSSSCFYLNFTPPPPPPSTPARRIPRRHKDGLVTGKPFLSLATLWILQTSCFCRGLEVWVFRYSCRSHVRRETAGEISFLKTRTPLGNLTLSNGDDDVFVWWWFSFLKSCLFTHCFLMHVSLSSSLKSGSYQY